MKNGGHLFFLKKRPRIGVGKVVAGVVLGIFIMGTLFPYIWVVLTSIKPYSELFQVPPTWIPEKPTIDNFYNVITNGTFISAFMNSVIVTFGTVALTLPIIIFSAYAFARLEFRGKSIILTGILVSQMVPVAVLLIPLYEVMTALHIIDTRFCLILTNLSFTVPFAVWMLRGYIRTIPKEIEESAKIDGCSRFGILWRIIIPIAAPGLAATVAYVFTMAWQEYMLALSLINSQSKFTLPIKLTSFVGQYGTQWGSLMAASILVALPTLAIFLFLQKFLVAGLCSGSVKG